MGSHWYLYGEKCPHCGEEIDEIIHAENNYDHNGQWQSFGTHKCEHCNQNFVTRIVIIVEKSSD
jgi:hypothetical protein